jgi:hypothetical protein
MRKLSKFRFVIPLVVLGLLPIKSAHAFFLTSFLIGLLVDELVTESTPVEQPKEPEGPDMSDPAVLANYMSQPFNTRFIDAENIDETDEYEFGNCGDNFDGTRIASKYLGYYGRVAGEIAVYGYRNVLVSYYYDGKDGEHDWGELMGSKLSTGIPTYEKETVIIRIADEVGDIWENKLSDLMRIECSNLYIDDPEDDPVNTVYDYGKGFMVLPVVEVIQTGDQFYGSFLPHEGGLRLFDYQVLVPDDTRKSTAKLDTSTGLLLIPELVTDEGTNYAVYYTEDGWTFKEPVATKVDTGTEYGHSYNATDGEPRIASVATSPSTPVLKEKDIEEAEKAFRDAPKFDPDDFHYEKYEGRNQTSFDGLVIPQNAGGIVTSMDSDEL